MQGKVLKWYKTILFTKVERSFFNRYFNLKRPRTTLTTWLKNWVFWGFDKYLTWHFIHYLVQSDICTTTIWFRTSLNLRSQERASNFYANLRKHFIQYIFGNVFMTVCLCKSVWVFACKCIFCACWNDWRHRIWEEKCLSRNNGDLTLNFCRHSGSSRQTIVYKI